MHEVIAKVVKMPGEKECCVSKGKLLMQSGVKLKQGFGATGYSEDIRFSQDFSSRMYFMEKVEEEEDDLFFVEPMANQPAIRHDDFVRNKLNQMNNTMNTKIEENKELMDEYNDLIKELKDLKKQYHKKLNDITKLENEYKKQLDIFIENKSKEEK